MIEGLFIVLAVVLLFLASPILAAGAVALVICGAVHYLCHPGKFSRHCRELYRGFRS